jgi:hypothetical protein
LQIGDIGGMDTVDRKRLHQLQLAFRETQIGRTLGDLPRRL